MVLSHFRVNGCLHQEVNCDESMCKAMQFERRVDMLVLPKSTLLSETRSASARNPE
jgi:hypothetical protein